MYIKTAHQGYLGQSFTEFTTVIQKYFGSVCMHNNALNVVQLEGCNEGV